MAKLEPKKQEIEQVGSLVFIAAQRRGGMVADPVKFFESGKYTLPFLLDEDRSVTKAYGVYKLLSFDSINIARPATLVVDKSGIIRYVYVGNSQLDRAPTEKVLQAFAAVK